jgi:hypothetical protein
MTRITIFSGHPVTVIAAGPIHYYFGRLVGRTESAIRVHLRRAVQHAHAINIRGVIVETVGGVTVEVDCRNVTSPTSQGGSLLILEIVEPSSLDIRVSPEATSP